MLQGFWIAFRSNTPLQTDEIVYFPGTSTITLSSRIVLTTNLGISHLLLLLLSLYSNFTKIQNGRYGNCYTFNSEPDRILKTERVGPAYGETDRVVFSLFAVSLTTCSHATVWGRGRGRGETSWLFSGFITLPGSVLFCIGYGVRW